MSKDVKLFGITINTLNHPNHYAHVQSYLFIIDLETLHFLKKEKIFDTRNYTTSKYDTIIKKEIPLSRKIIENGWNISSLLKYYHGVDFRKPYKSKRPPLSDVMFKEHENKLWKRKELLFIKGNRDLP